MDLTKEWDNVQGDGSGSRLVTGVTIVNNDFLKEHVNKTYILFNNRLIPETASS